MGIDADEEGWSIGVARTSSKNTSSEASGA
jgi:hypothetical protein